MKNLTAISSLVIAAMMASCQCDRSKTTTNDFDAVSTTAENESTTKDDLNRSRTILYTLPAPVEVASLIKESGVRYDEELLNSISKVNTYNTNLKMALNLGIYSTDMSFANIFEQSQKTVDYITSLKQLTERLGIVQLIDEETIQKFESQGTSKEEMLNIISEVYINANQYLNENNRKNIAVAVVVGGWTEGLYIALNIVNSNEPNKALTERIIAQKLALVTVLNLIESNNQNGNDEDLTYIYNKMLEIKTIFDEAKIEQQGQVLATTDANAKLTRIKANIQSGISPETLNMLTEKVNQVRSEFVE